MSKITDYQSKIKVQLDQYDQMGNELTFVTIPDSDYGMFDSSHFSCEEERRKYSREIDGETVRTIVYELFEGYVKSFETSSDVMMLLHLIKGSLRVKSADHHHTYKSLVDFWEQLSGREYKVKWHGRYLQLLSDLYEKRCAKGELDTHIRKKKQQGEFNLAKDSRLSFLTSAAVVHILVSTVFSAKPDEPYLMEDYTDFVGLIARFA